MVGLGREPQTPDSPLGLVCGVCLCGKGRKGLSQGLPRSLRSEGSGVELCPEGRGECQALAREEEADPLESVVPTVEKVQEGTSALSPFLLLADAGGSWMLICAGPLARLSAFLPFLCIALGFPFLPPPLFIV